MTSQKALDWLLEEEQPPVRYLTLRHLLGKSEQDPEVRATRARIPETGWAAEILAQRHPEGWWANPARIYTPKYLSTNWMLLVLSDLGLSCAHPAIRASCELWMARSSSQDGGFGINGAAKSHLCYIGNMTRALLKFGYVNDARVGSALDWLVRNAHHLGGWSCWGSGRNLDSWEGLSAFAAYPKTKWTAAMARCVEEGAEFYLERELYRQGDRYEPWFRFHYPVHYYYDLLVGLDLLTSLGYTEDRRLRFALSHLRKRRRHDGRWNLDAVHPDLEGAAAAWYASHPKQWPVPFALETVGRPSKMVTLTASRVLARLDGTT